MTDFPPLPGPATRLAGLLPRPPLAFALTALSRRIAARHPGIVTRLGAHAGKRFALDPTDLPMVLILDLPGGRPRITVARDAEGADCHISGRLSALLALVHGAADGDALFFSRDLTLGGDTAAALALRNAVDDAELDLLEETATLAPPMRRALGLVAGAVERRYGVALHRVAEGF